MTLVEKMLTITTPNILVVDDEKNNRRLFTKFLKNSDYIVDEAESGERALELINQNLYNLVISDLHMYQVSGLDVLEAAKQKDESTQVLILTGFGSIQSAVKAMKNGATDFMAKPVNYDEFNAKVKKALERRKFHKLLEEQQNRLSQYHDSIQRDLNLAKKIHKTLIPKNTENDYVSVSLQYLPMIGLGGDFAYVFDNQNGTIYLSVIDVTGHGIAAALMVNRLCAEVGNLIRDELEPFDILYQLNRFFCDTFSNTGMFATVFVAKLEQESKTLTYSGAAHPALYLCNSKSFTCKQYDSQNTIIGFDYGKKEDFLQNTVQVKSGDKIIMYTDGVLESENKDQIPFGVDGLTNAILKSSDKNVSESVEYITSELKSFCKNNLRDDVLVLVANVK
jgi:serine phosphatase RsbU (regulator of sigma subunit)